MNQRLTIAPRHGGAGCDYAGIAAQTQCAALVDEVVLPGHEIDDLVDAQLVEFTGMGIGQAGHMAGKLNHRNLHTQTDAEIGHVLFPGVLCRQNHTLNAPAAKAAGHNDAVQTCQLLCVGFRGKRLGIDPLNFHL